MDAANIARVLVMLDAVLTAGANAVSKANALIQTARTEGRDISDAELDTLQADSKAALQRFHDATKASA